MYQITLIFCIVSYFVISKSDLKTWSFSTNYDRQNNWDLGRLPCSNDKIIFDKQQITVALLSSNIAFKQMVLPRNGQLLLNSGTTLGLAKIGDDTCSGKDIKYLASASKFWFDPRNWNITSESVLNDFKTENPIPHAYRVPCQLDNVVFPEMNSFSVILQGNMPCQVQSLTINGKAYGTEDFEKLKNDRKQRYFEGDGLITIIGDSCNDLTGCISNNLQNDVMSYICSNIPPCKPVSCVDPIEVEGHCCPVCGSLLDISYKRDFKFENLRKELEAFAAKDYLNLLACYVWKSQHEKVQVLCLDQVSDKEEAAKRFLRSMSNLLLLDESLNLNKIELKSSSKWKTESSGVGAGGVIGIMLAMFCIIFLIVGGIVLYRKKRFPAVSFVRFDTDIGKIEMELGTTPHEDLQPSGSPVSGSGQAEVSVGRAFHNPLFGLKPDKKFAGFPKYIKESAKENPIYGIEEADEE